LSRYGSNRSEGSALEKYPSLEWEASILRINYDTIQHESCPIYSGHHGPEILDRMTEAKLVPQTRFVFGRGLSTKRKICNKIHNPMT